MQRVVSQSVGSSKRLRISAVLLAVLVAVVGLAPAALGASPSVAVSVASNIAYVNGSSYPAYSTVAVTAEINGLRGSSNVKASSTGAFSTRFQLPTGISGNLTIRAQVGSITASKTVSVVNGNNAPTTTTTTTRLPTTTTTAPPSPLIANTTSGRLQGANGGQVDRFMGVRYAKPPVGDLRFAPTQPAAFQSGTVDASKAGLNCPQTANAAANVEGEDCLTLNVTRPAGKPAQPLPVIVWWHGGGYREGSGALYDPAGMSYYGNTLVITVNYRLGDLGTLALPGLEGAGNFGFADQLESLRWIRQNAAAFGGDPANVTIAGESAGAFSACAALNSPAAAGLFDKAIMSSGSCMVDWATGTLGRGSARTTLYTPLATAEQSGVNRAAALGCTGPDTLACLRTKPVSAMTPSPNLTLPSYNTPLIPKDPAQGLRDGPVNKVPVLSGSNHDEVRIWTALVQASNQPYTAAEYPGLISTAFGAGNADRVRAAYPLSNYQSPGLAWTTMLTDATWACPTYAGNQLTAAHMPTYAYEFNDQTAPAGYSVPGFPFGAYHSADLQYLFGIVGQPYSLNTQQTNLASTLISYWVNFARSGNPNTGLSVPSMPAFNGTGAVTSLAPGTGGIRATNFVADHKCSLWSSVVW